MQRRLLRSVPLGLSLLALLIATYLLQFNATFRSDDEHILAARSQSLALSGQLEAPQVYGNDRVRQLQAWGDAATQVEPGLSVFGAGLYRFGISLGWGGRQTLFTSNIYATAISALLVYLTVAVSGYGRITGLTTAAAFGFSSMAVPYAGTFYRDPLAMLFVAACGLGLALHLAAENPRQRRAGFTIALLGLLLGVLTKNSVLALAPALLLGLALHWSQNRAGMTHRRVVVALLLAVLVIIVTALLPERGPLARFSLAYYLDLGRHFIASLSLDSLAGLIGPWLSPARSLLIFSPPLLLLLAVRRTVKLPAALLVTFLGFALLLGSAQVLFYGVLWGSGFGWGLRYMLPALPGLFVMLAPGVEWLRQGARWQQGLLVALLLLGGLIQMAGSLVPWSRVYRAWQAAGLDPYGPGAPWRLELLRVGPQLRSLLQPQLWDTAWLRLLRSGSANGAWFILLALLLAGAAVWVLLRSLDRPLAMRWTALLASISLLAPLLAQPLLAGDPGLADNRRAYHDTLAWLAPRLEPHDQVVVDSYATPLWTFFSNRWDQSHKWHSLPYEIPGAAGAADLHPASEALFDELLAGEGRLWYLTTPESPDHGLGRELEWLDRHAVRIVGGTVGVEHPVEIYLFTSGAPAE